MIVLGCGTRMQGLRGGVEADPPGWGDCTGKRCGRVLGVEGGRRQSGFSATNAGKSRIARMRERSRRGSLGVEDCERERQDAEENAKKGRSNAIEIKRRVWFGPDFAWKVFRASGAQVIHVLE